MWPKFLLLSVILLAACAVEGDGTAPEEEGLEETAVSPTPPTSPASTEAATPTDSAVATNRRVETEDRYPISFLLGFDDIRPIYDPQFVPAGEAPLDDDELVMGIAWGDEAKAYPVTVMRFREIVNDELAGIPTLVTW